MTGGEVGDMEGQALLAGGGRTGGCGGGGAGGGGGDEDSCPSSSEELSSVRSMTSTFLPLPDEEDPCCSAGEACVRHTPAGRRLIFNTVLLTSRGVTKAPPTIQPVVVGRSGDLLHLLLGPHGGPAAVLLELDLVTIGAAVEDLHKEPANQKHDSFIFNLA